MSKLTIPLYCNHFIKHVKPKAGFAQCGEPQECDGTETQKIVILGSGGVGKSAVIVRFVTGKFTETYDPTIEDSHDKVINVDDKFVSLNILDTAGQEEFRSMNESHISQGQGFIIMYDITQKITFDQAIFFYNKVKKIKPHTPIILVGNKVDLDGDARQVTTAQGESAALGKCLFLESSAKWPQNVDKIFETLSKEIFSVKPTKKIVKPTLSKRKKRFCVIL